MTKADPSSSLSPFQRFAKLGKALFASQKRKLSKSLHASNVSIAGENKLRNLSRSRYV